MKNTYFITGTDTDAGKTLITTALLFKAKKEGLRTLGLKPIAAGFELACDGTAKHSDDGVPQNDDAVALLRHATVELSYQQINPQIFKAATSPHIAAQKENKRIDVDRLVGLVRGSLSYSYDLALIEGAGGLLVPLNERHTVADLIAALNCPVILTIGLKLGCLNHSLLTYEVLSRRGIKIAGWIGTELHADMPYFEENIATLRSWIAAPCLGTVRYAPDDQFSSETDRLSHICEQLVLPS